MLVEQCTTAQEVSVVEDLSLVGELTSYCPLAIDDARITKAHVKEVEN